MMGRFWRGLSRFRTVFLGDLLYHSRRPLFAMWALVLALTAWGLSGGNVRIVSGDASVGGTKAHMTSEFAVAMQLAIFTTMFYAFFISVAAGMAIIQDEEWRLGDMLHATALRRANISGRSSVPCWSLACPSCVFTWRRAFSSFTCCPMLRRRSFAAPSMFSIISSLRSSFRYRRSFSWQVFRSRSANGRAGRCLCFCCRWRS